MHELKKVDDEVFLDRDGKTFETLVNYLRNNRKVFPEFSDKNMENHFYKELHYWGIDREHKKWQEDYLKKLDKTIDVGHMQHITHIQANNMRADQRQSLESHFPSKQSPPHRTSALSPNRLVAQQKKYFDPKDYADPELADTGNFLDQS